MIGFAEIRANAWKIAAFAGLAGVAAASFFLLLAQVENRRLVKVNDSLDKRVVAETQARVQAETNTEQLKTAFANQKQQMERRAAEDARVLADTRQRLAAAQRETRDARDQVNAFLRRPPQGSTICEQYEDIDRRGMEDLK